MQCIGFFVVLSKFLSAGAVGVLLGYFLLYTLTEFLGVWYVLSAIVAFGANFSSNFLLHKHWTFKSNGRGRTQRQLLPYTLLVIVLFCTNTGLLYAQVEFLQMWYIAAQVVNTIVLTIISFFCTRWIFSH